MSTIGLHNLLFSRLFGSESKASVLFGEPPQTAGNLEQVLPPTADFATLVQSLLNQDSSRIVGNEIHPIGDSPKILETEAILTEIFGQQVEVTPLGKESGFEFFEISFGATSLPLNLPEIEKPLDSNGFHSEFLSFLFPPDDSINPPMEILDTELGPRVEEDLRSYLLVGRADLKLSPAPNGDSREIPLHLPVFAFFFFGESKSVPVRIEDEAQSAIKGFDLPTLPIRRGEDSPKSEPVTAFILSPQLDPSIWIPRERAAVEDSAEPVRQVPEIDPQKVPSPLPSTRLLSPEPETGMTTWVVSANPEEPLSPIDNSSVTPPRLTQSMIGSDGEPVPQELEFHPRFLHAIGQAFHRIASRAVQDWTPIPSPSPILVFNNSESVKPPTEVGAIQPGEVTTLPLAVALPESMESHETLPPQGASEIKMSLEATTQAPEPRILEPAQVALENPEFAGTEKQPDLPLLIRPEIEAIVSTTASREASVKPEVASLPLPETVQSRSNSVGKVEEEVERNTAVKASQPLPDRVSAQGAPENAGEEYPSPNKVHQEGIGSTLVKDAHSAKALTVPKQVPESPILPAKAPDRIPTPSQFTQGERPLVASEKVPVKVYLLAGEIAEKLDALSGRILETRLGSRQIALETPLRNPSETQPVPITRSESRPTESLEGIVKPFVSMDRKASEAHLGKVFTEGTPLASPQKLPSTAPSQLIRSELTERIARTHSPETPLPPNPAPEKASTFPPMVVVRESVRVGDHPTPNGNRTASEGSIESAPTETPEPTPKRSVELRTELEPSGRVEALSLKGQTRFESTSVPRRIPLESLVPVLTSPKEGLKELSRTPAIATTGDSEVPATFVRRTLDTGPVTVSEPIGPIETLTSPSKGVNPEPRKVVPVASEVDSPASIPMTEGKSTSPAEISPIAKNESQATHVRENEILNQIAKTVQNRTLPQGSEIRIRLIPESLGEIHLKITVREGQVIAEIRASSEATRDLLVKHTTQLQTLLGESGIGLEKVVIRTGNFGSDLQIQSAQRRESADPQDPQEGGREESKDREEDRSQSREESRKNSRRRAWGRFV